MSRRPTASAARPMRTTIVVFTTRVSRPPIWAPIDDGDARGHEPQAGLDRGQMLCSVLQQHGQHEEEAELSHREDRGGDQPVSEAQEAELAELEQRVGSGRSLRRSSTTKAPSNTSREDEHRDDRRSAASRARRRVTAMVKSCNGLIQP